MLLDHGQLCVVEVLSHIGQNTSNDVSGVSEPFLAATAPRPLLNNFEERWTGALLQGCKPFLKVWKIVVDQSYEFSRR